MKKKIHIKIGDQVMVIAGNSKGNSGRIMEIDRKNYRAVVEGQNMVTKHQKPSANNPDGELLEIEGTIHISNLMLIDPDTNKPRRVKRVKGEDGKTKLEFKKHPSIKSEA